MSRPAWLPVSKASRKHRRANARKESPQALLRVTQLEDRTTPTVTFSGPTNIALTGNTPYAVVSGNFNADAFLDLAVANIQSAEVTILLGNGSGGFAKSGVFSASGGGGTGSRALAAGDFDGDGDQDLAVVNGSSTRNVQLLINNGSGVYSSGAALTVPNGDTALAVAAATLDNNTSVDLAVCTGAGKVYAFFNNGKGTFGSGALLATAGSGSVGIVATDLTADGKPDLVAANSGSNDVTVLVNNGNGTFTTRGPFATGAGSSSPNAVAVGKLNADAFPDLVVANDTGKIAVLAGDGTGNFGPAAEFSSGGANPTSVVVADFDGDGKPDVATTNLTSDNVAVLLGDGAGALGGAQTFATAAGANPQALVAGLFDGNAKPDIAAINSNTSAHNVGVLLNTSSPPATVTASISGGALTVTDTAGNANNFTVSASGLNVTVSDAGQNFTFTTPIVSVPNGIVINGNGGNDTLTTVGSIPVAIAFDGGAGGSDALRVTGAGLVATYTPSHTTPGAGTLTIVGGPTIIFTGLEPIDFDVTGGTFTLDTGAGTADAITVVDGTLIDGTTAALKMSGSVGGVAIENARVRGSAVGILTNDGVDTVTISSASGAHTDTGLSVNAGATAGDTITVNGTATFSGTTTLNAATINLNADVTNGIAGSTATAVNVTAPAQIQDAVNVAASGATVSVAAGAYTENVVLSKPLTLRGAQSGVDARGRVAGETILTPLVPATRTLELRTGVAGSVIDGFTFSGGSRAIESTSGPLDDLQINNNRVVGFTGSGAFLNDNGNNVTVNQNVFDGSGQVGNGDVFHLDTDEFTGFVFTNNNVVNGGAANNGFFVDGNRNVRPSVGAGARNPLVSGNLFGANQVGANIGSRALQNATISNNNFTGNDFDGLQGGPKDSVISRNTFANNGRTGLALTSFGNAAADRGAQNAVVTENVFSGNGQEDLAYSAVQAAGTISTNRAFNNSFGSARAITYDGAEVVDNGNNWYGSSVLATIQAKIAGAGAAKIDYSPYLNTGTDTDGATAGFQGSFADLTVHPAGSQFGPGGRITEAYNSLTPTGTLHILSGSYTEDVDFTAGPDKAVTLAPGASPGQVTLAGNLTLDANDALQIEIGGTNPTTDYDNLVVKGTVNLGGAALGVAKFGGFAVAPPSQSFTIIDNDGTDAVNGSFAGLPEGSPISYAGGIVYISYHGGDGNDVVLYAAPIVNGTAGADTFVFRQVSGSPGQYELSVNGYGGSFANLGAITSLAVNGLGGNDTFVIDNANGNALLAGGIVYDGGAPTTGPGDKLQVVNGTYTTIASSFTNAHDGIIRFDGRAVTYSHLEPVLLNVGGVANVIFNLPAAGSAATLGDDGTKGNGLLRLSGSPTTFEATDFTAPTASLTINRGNAGDTVTAADLTDFNGGSNLLLGSTGNGFSTVTFAGPVALNNLGVFGTAIVNTAAASVAAAGSAAFDGGTITLGTTAGDNFNFGTLTFTGAGAVTISEDSGTLLAGTNAADSLALSSTAGIANFTGASLGVANNANFNGTAIDLGAQAGDNFNFGTLTFNTAGSVTIAVDGGTTLAGTSTASSLALTAAGGIGNTTSATLTVTGLANFGGTAIDLGNQTGDAMNFGSLTASSAGGVNIAEDSDMAVNAVSGSTVALTSTGAIQDNNAAGANNVTAATGMLTAGTTINLDTTLTNLALSAGGKATVREFDGLNINSANVGASVFELGTAGLTTQSGPITAGGFRFTGTGAAMLADTTNNVATLAASRDGSLTYVDADSLTVGTVTGATGTTSGVTLAPAGSLSLSALSGALLVNQAVTAPGSVLLTASDPTAATLTIAAAVSGGAMVSLSTAGGNDLIGVTATGSVTGTGMVFVNGFGGNDTFTIDGPVSGPSAFVLGGAGNDLFALATSGASTLNFNGEDGNDATTIALGTLNGTIAVNDSGTAPGQTDTLTIQGTVAADVYDANTNNSGNTSVRVTGTGVSGGADTVTYDAGVDQMTLDAQGGDDTYNLWFSQGSGSYLPGLVVIQDTGSSTNDVASISGTDAADTIDVNFSAVRTTTRGSETIRYTNKNLDVLNVFSKLGADTVFAKAVTNDGGPVVNLDGGPPTAPTPLPGDTLVLNVLGVSGLVGANIQTPAGNLTSTTHNVLTWASFETLPVPIGLGGTFDFGGAGSPVQTGPYAPYWKGVTGADVYPTNGYYGWTTPVNSYDRVGNAPQLAASDYAGALVDGNWFGPTGVTGTFNVATIASGQYQVTVTIGDTEVVMDDVLVTVEGAAPILVPTAFQNQYATVTTLGADANNDGKISITFEDTGGAHRYWHVNAMDVRPMDLISPVTIDRIDPTTKAVQANATQQADGLTATTYQAAGFFPNAVVSLAATGGTLVGVNPTTGADAADADPFLIGLQVRTDANGIAYFRLQAPTGNAPVTLTANSAIVVDAKGTYTQPFALPAARKIDFGPAGSPVAAGYLGVGPALYTGAGSSGLGWLQAVNATDRGPALGGPLFGDFVWNQYLTTGELNIDVPTGDPQAVTIYVGDYDAPVDTMTIEYRTAGGYTMLAADVRSVKTNSLTFTVTPVAIGGGNYQMRFRFGDVTGPQNGWKVQGIEYRPVSAQAVLGIAPTGSVAGDGLTVTTYTVTGPAGALVTVTPKYGTILTADASPTYDGLQILLAGGSATLTLQSPVVAVGTVDSPIGLVTVDGVAAGGFTQQYTASAVKYDFGPAGSPVAGGFKGVTGVETFSNQTGYGFAGPVGAFDRDPAQFPAVAATAAPALFRDGVNDYTSGTFKVLVQPGQAGIVATVYAFDAYSPRGPITVAPEGGSPQTLLADGVTPVTFTVTGKDLNGDGVFEVTIAATFWTANGIGIGSALLAATPAGRATGETLSGDALTAITAEAIRRWSALDLTPAQRAALGAVTVTTADLGSAGLLGVTTGTHVAIDDNAAGTGWFIDPTPGDDAEFVLNGVDLTGLGAAAGRYDLLTVVEHEIGHALGFAHLTTPAPGYIMDEDLSAGVRREPALPAVGALAERVLAPALLPNSDGSLDVTLKTGTLPASASVPVTFFGVAVDGVKVPAEKPKAAEPTAGQNRVAVQPPADGFEEI